jgi:hypothetical protein
MQTAHSTDWFRRVAGLIARPTTGVDGGVVRVAVGIRRDVNVRQGRARPREAAADSRGTQGLSCHKSEGRQQRHVYLVE